MLILKLLFLLVLANGAPVIAKRLLGERFAVPVDGGVRFFDGRALFGPSKTVRGILSSVFLSALAAFLMGIEWQIGALFGAMAMVGDLFSSFVKRRMNLPSSSMALGLDQVPESLFPVLAVYEALDLTVVDVVTLVAAFFVLELLLSRVLYRLRVRDRPY